MGFPAPMEARVRLFSFILSIMVDVIPAVETILGATDDSVALASPLGSIASKALESTRGDAPDRDGVVPRPEVEELLGVALLLVDSWGVVEPASLSAAASRRVGV